MQIDFVVPGFSKCGTTTLCDLLNSHSEIFIPPGKEPGYYAENFHKGRTWYQQSFLTRAEERLAGDGSTTYSSEEFAEVASDRILADSPACKFIFIARNPKKRLESSFREMHASGYKYGVLPSFEFGEALQQLPNMVADTKYHRLINVFLRKVDASQIHVIFLEDLQAKPEQVYGRCLEFLGLESEPLPDQDRQLNPASSKVCDTRLLRWLRTNPATSRLWGKLSLSSQEWLMEKFRLRRPFRSAVQWNDYARRVFEAEVAPEARQFLLAFGKPAGFWGLEGDSQKNRAASRGSRAA